MDSDVEDSEHQTAADPINDLGPERKKRKLVDVEPIAKQPTKRVKGRRGLLKDLMGMPMDVLFEVFCHLEPVGLLHLSRTTKAFRKTLMSKTSKHIWKSSFDGIDPSPPTCPEDLTEPAYADLLFGKGCHYCGRHTSAMRVAWQCRVRTCRKCLSLNFTQTPYLVSRVRDKSRLAGMPVVYIRFPAGRVVSGAYHLTAHEREWKDEYNQLCSEEARQEWCGRKITAAKILQDHETLCTDWVSAREKVLSNTEKIAVDARKAMVTKHLREMGWAVELDNLSTKDEHEYLSLTAVSKACQKPLTERILRNLEPCLTEFMEDVRDSRLRRERHASLKGRLVILDDVYNRYLATLPAGFGYANTADIFLLPSIRDIIDMSNSDFCESDYDRLIAAFPLAQDAWKTGIQKKLAGIAQVAVREGEELPGISSCPELFEGDTTAFFLCDGCDGHVYVTDMPTHPCARIFRSLDWGCCEQVSSDDLRALRESIKQVPWNALRHVTFQLDVTQEISSVFQRLGFKSPPLSEDLDKVDPIIECLLCHSDSLGRYTMKWRQLATHLRSHRFNNAHTPKHFTLVDEPEASGVRSRMEEAYAKKVAQSTQDDYAMCSSCRQRGKYPALLKHAKVVHAATRPTMGKDVIINPYLKHSYVHRLWPPLDQDEVDALLVD